MQVSFYIIKQIFKSSGYFIFSIDEQYVKYIVNRYSMYFLRLN